ncbi:hypothetical protein, partial [Marivivens sp.]|uniref:hypothetical protein n=1 Tax=Marivivens sp. TaxID=1978374 RepID=UPI0025BB419E
SKTDLQNLTPNFANFVYFYRNPYISVKFAKVCNPQHLFSANFLRQSVALDANIVACLIPSRLDHYPSTRRSSYDLQGRIRQLEI